MTYKVQIDDQVRNANADEIAAIKAMAAEKAAQEIEIATRAQEKAALLEKLGLTADEAALLLS
jgi:hypothetical protein